MSEALLTDLRDAIINLDESRARELASGGVEQGVDPLDMIQHAIRAALDLVGERFSAGAVFLPELMLAAKAADAAVAALEPELLKRGTRGKTLGKVLLATVEGDLHDIGKNILALLMRSAGFEIVDIGVDKTSEQILDAALKNAVDLIGLSALLTTTMPRMREFIESLEESGLRDRVKVIVGGAPITQEFADSIGADGYGADGAAGIAVARRLLDT